ncbi:MAG: hypothetical protein EHM36_03875, partial [Deltaproteobacteria bacterium]
MFGHGAIEGVAGPETANNAATAGGFVPLLTLGIPTNSVLALMLAAMMLHGVSPGPLLLIKWPDVFWGVIASMYIGNIMLLVLNVPMIGLFVKILKVPKALEAGAGGVIVPHTHDRKDVEEIVKAAKFPPRGKRGYGGLCLSGQWGVDAGIEWMEWSNA